MNRLTQSGLRAGVALLGALTLAGCAGAHGQGATGGPRPSGARLVDSIGATGPYVWAIDRHGYFWLTADKGRTWRVAGRQTLGVARGPGVVADVVQVQFVDDRHGWMSAGLGDGRRDGIERTVNGGRSWRVLPLPGCSCEPAYLSFYDVRHGYLIDDTTRTGAPEKLFWTNDGGTSWTLLPRPPASGSIWFGDRTLGLLLTPAGSNSDGSDHHPPRTYRTTDGGETWSPTRLRPLPPDVVPRGATRRLVRGWESVVFSAPRVGWAIAGRYHELYRTTDGGRDWWPMPLRRRVRSM